MKNFFYLTLILLIFSSCSNQVIKKSEINENNLDMQVIEAYTEGVKSLEGGDVLFAAKKFNEAEILFPQSIWAPKAALMAAYAYYSQDYYQDSISELNRFIKVYPKHKDVDYAYYLMALSYYEQIVDETKDLQSIINAKKFFIILIEKYPMTEYALDAEFKLNLINDILASKEMYIGRYYIDRKKWIPAINRFKTILDEYETTIYTEEALHRLVEIYYRIGLINESKKYAKLLGYNYQSSEWYEKSYIIFNKKYDIQKKKKKKKNKSILNRIKSLGE